LTQDPNSTALMAKLRTLRSAIAREERVPAYVVFSDHTLSEIVRRRPRSVTALSDIRGVGPVKLDRYGERFLAVVRDTDGTASV
jgi:superfamily II DNA helicase RecQ